jgi:benzoate/toluate 1,2-dioxygenase beta subunit
MDGDVQRWFAVQRFLFQEARLLDERRLDEWLALFAPEAEYWVPYAWGQASPRDHVSIVWETVPLLRMRVDRLMHDDVPMQWPASRVNHHLSNLMADAPGPDGTISARAYLLYVEHRRDEQRFFSGRCTWRLTPASGGFLIALKRIDLLNADQESGHLRLSVPF